MSITIHIEKKNENGHYVVVPGPELNMANSNFSTLWSALGFEFDWCGALCPDIVLAALRRFDPDLAVRETRIHKHDGFCTMVACGLDENQIQRYRSCLSVICDEAKKSGNMVGWG